MPTLENGTLRVEIAERGAELRSISTLADDAQWLWNGEAAWWTGRSPLLFPVVGQSPGGEVTIAGDAHPMAPHGFACNSRFRLVDATPEAAELELLPDDATRAAFPFEFRLSVRYRIEADRLICNVTVGNRDRRDMPFQFGFHPAFRWPLPGAEGQPHRVELEDNRSPAMLRLEDSGLLGEMPCASPFEAGVLALDPLLFTAGAMVFPGGGGPLAFAGGAARIEMETRNLPTLALWQKPGAPFLCLEPWQGTAPFPAQGAALENRNQALRLGPGENADFEMSLRFVLGRGLPSRTKPTM